MLGFAGCGGGGGGTQDRGAILQSQEAQQINKAIIEQGADWYADDNEISRLSEAERDRFLGAELPRMSPFPPIASPCETR